jgi:hypothetical protein
VGPRARLDGCGKSRPTGIRSPDRPARSKSSIEEDNDDDYDDDNNNTIKAAVLQISTSTNTLLYMLLHVPRPVVGKLCRHRHMFLVANL